MIFLKYTNRRSFHLTLHEIGRQSCRFGSEIGGKNYIFWPEKAFNEEGGSTTTSHYRFES